MLLLILLVASDNFSFAFGENWILWIDPWYIFGVAIATYYCLCSSVYLFVSCIFCRCFTNKRRRPTSVVLYYKLIYESCIGRWLYKCYCDFLPKIWEGEENCHLWQNLGYKLSILSYWLPWPLSDFYHLIV